MEKTKLGVSVGLMGAGLYFLGAVSLIPAVLLAGYVLLREENEWLRKTAVKMLAIVIGFALASLAISAVQEIFSILHYVVGWIFSNSISVPLNLDSICRNVLSLVEFLLLFALGFNALGKGSMKVGFADKIVEKHM